METQKSKIYTDQRLNERINKHVGNDDVLKQTFIDLQKKCLDVYLLKNERYGNSFDKSLEEDGLLVSKIRLNDKMLRFSQLIKNPNLDSLDESIEDTLMDMANYALMTVSYIQRRKENR